MTLGNMRELGVTSPPYGVAPRAFCVVPLFSLHLTKTTRLTGPFLYLRLFIAIALFPS